MRPAAFPVFNIHAMTDAPAAPLPEQSATLKAGDLIRPDPGRFTADIDALLKRAESMRLSCMKRKRSHDNLNLTLSLVFLLAGAAGFGWFLLIEADLIRAVGSMLLALAIPVMLMMAPSRGLEEYRRSYKEEFLPALAAALGGFRFSPVRGINPKIVGRTGVLPAHAVYNAEDCFAGRYKDVKVVFSEARLYGDKKKTSPVFSGLFVLLEAPGAPIAGHTIVTSDRAMYDQWRHTRWQKLQDVQIPLENPESLRFRIVSSAPESAMALTGDRFLKELGEAADIFDNAPVSAALFQEKFIFIAIPHAGDMFEPSDIYLPIATRRHILQIRREIEQIFEIIDIFELYGAKAGAGAGPKPGDETRAHDDEHLAPAQTAVPGDTPPDSEV